jgi:hypothetical protein
MCTAPTSNYFVAVMQLTKGAAVQRIVRLLIVLFVLIGGALGLAAPAAAQSPTQQISFHDCVQSDPYLVCTTGEGLQTIVQTGSGRQVVRVKLTTTTEFFNGKGQLVGSTKNQLLQFEVFFSGTKEDVVFHREFDSVTTLNGTTCTTNHSVVNAGGTVRHAVNDVVCTP